VLARTHANANRKRRKERSAKCEGLSYVEEEEEEEEEEQSVLQHGISSSYYLLLETKRTKRASSLFCYGWDAAVLCRAVPYRAIRTVVADGWSILAV